MITKHRTRWLAALLAAFVAAPAAWAHGGQEHVMGTVSSVSATQVVVKTTKGVERTVQLTADTKIEKDGEPSTTAALRPGQRVVVHTRKQGDALTAVLIKTGGVPHGSHEGHEGAAAVGK
jgi:hypothetical protein